ncbi:hypothetical protein BGZ50_008340 [Haplosporangium sp. Z 11]|nr:hypothetical protein BGZ50_008340 [Haplosporangium sp. Z 11]
MTFGHPLSDPASDFHDEDGTSTLSGITDSTFLDPQHPHSQLCGTSDTQLAPFPAARPKALTLEGAEEPQMDASSADQRRKHRSEIEGNSPIHDILVALRQNSELDSPMINQDDGSSETSAIAPMMGANMIEYAELPTITASDALDENDTKEVQEINLLSSSQLLKTTTPTVPEEPIAETADADTTLLSVLSPAMHVVFSDDNTAMALSRSMETTFEIGMVTESPNPPSSSSSTASSQSAGQMEQDKKEAKESKGSLLHRISVRKNSITESISTHDFPESSSTKFLSAGSNHSKSSKRSSRLLGKLVPKFLQTSLTPGLPSTTNSSASLPPACASRSSSIGSQSAFNKTGGLISADTTSSIAFHSTTSLSTRGSQESLVLETTFDQDEQGFMNTTAPQHLECLRADTRSPSLLGRRLSCSSYASYASSRNSLSSKPSGTSMSCVDPAESEAKHIAALRCENDEDEATEAEDEDQEISFAEQVNGSFNEPLPSPYIIDDDCDDAFFLNSVLRKKARPMSSIEPTTRPMSAMMTSSYPSNTTLSSMHSYATTPSISGWSSASSQPSTPSPTSPSFQNSQIYPFPAGTSPICARPPLMKEDYRSNPLPTPIHAGLDEKRCRLRDAVGEWRRSTNAST